MVSGAQKIYAVIPARGGSKGVPGKNIRALGGHPLIAYSIQAAKLCPEITRVIVSTDSEEIATVARKYGAEVPFLRPADISADRSTDYEFVLHALDWLQTHEKSEPDFLVHLRPTTPLRNPALISDAIAAMNKNPTSTALRSVHEMSESAYKSFEIRDGLLNSVGSHSFELDAANNARQAFPKTYYGNGYVDILSRDFIRKSQRLHGNQVFAYVTPTVVEVDTVEDFSLLEYQVARGLGFSVFAKN